MVLPPPLSVSAGGAADKAAHLMGESPLPSVARFGRQAYPGRGEVANHERPGRKKAQLPDGVAVAVGATWVASRPAGLNLMAWLQPCNKAPD